MSPGLKTGVIVLLMLSLSTSGNFRDAIHDLTGPAKSWWYGDARRIESLDSAVSGWDKLPPKPRLLMDSEVSDDASYWKNRCMANYIKVQRVFIRSQK